MNFTIEYTKKHQKIYRKNPEFIVTFIVEYNDSSMEFNTWEDVLRFINSNKKIKKNIYTKVFYKNKYIVDKNKKIAKNKLCGILLKEMDSDSED